MRFLYDEVGLLKVFHKSYKDKFHMAQQCSTKLTKIPLYITSILSFTDKQCCHSGNAEDIKVCFWCSQVCLFYPQLVIEDKREVLKFLSDFIDSKLLERLVYYTLEVVEWCLQSLELCRTICVIGKAYSAFNSYTCFLSFFSSLYFPTVRWFLICY